jgi:hypothetical protein
MADDLDMARGVSRAGGGSQDDAEACSIRDQSRDLGAALSVASPNFESPRQDSIENVIANGVDEWAPISGTHLLLDLVVN